LMKKNPFISFKSQRALMSITIQMTAATPA